MKAIEIGYLIVSKLKRSDLPPTPSPYTPPHPGRNSLIGLKCKIHAGQAQIFTILLKLIKILKKMLRTQKFGFLLFKYI